MSSAISMRLSSSILASSRTSSNILVKPSAVNSAPRLFLQGSARRRLARPTVMRAVAEVIEVKEAWWAKNQPPNMIDINGVQELIEALANAGEKLVVADLYASWCNACKGVYPKLVQLCNDNPDIIMLKINFDDNKAIAKALNIKVLPYFIFYRGADGQLDAFSASLSKIARLREAVEKHNTPRCSLGPPAGLNAFPELKSRMWSPVDPNATRVDPCSEDPSSQECLIARGQGSIIGNSAQVSA